MPVLIFQLRFVRKLPGAILFSSEMLLLLFQFLIKKNTNHMWNNVRFSK